MNRIAISLLTLGFVTIVGVARAQDAADMQMPKPGPEHERLKSLVGEFTFVNKMRHGPELPWGESTGTKSGKLVAGGFFLQTKEVGNFSGMEFEGHMTLGFDTIKKKYVGTWIDSFGSTITPMEGGWDEAKKSLSLVADMLIPQTGENAKVGFITEIKDADSHVFRMYVPGPDGKQYNNMEITYKRAKAK